MTSPDSSAPQDSVPSSSTPWKSGFWSLFTVQFQGAFSDNVFNLCLFFRKM